LLPLASHHGALRFVENDVFTISTDPHIDQLVISPFKVLSLLANMPHGWGNGARACSDELT
jgi:hypothetical protein